MLPQEKEEEEEEEEERQQQMNYCRLHQVPSQRHLVVAVWAEAQRLRAEVLCLGRSRYSEVSPSLDRGNPGTKSG